MDRYPGGDQWLGAMNALAVGRKGDEERRKR
jgi:hypothetical protein